MTPNEHKKRIAEDKTIIGNLRGVINELKELNEKLCDKKYFICEKCNSKIEIDEDANLHTCDNCGETYERCENCKEFYNLEDNYVREIDGIGSICEQCLIDGYGQ